MHGRYCVVHVVGNKEVARSKAASFVQAWQLAQKLNRKGKESELASQSYYDVERAALVTKLPIVKMGG